MDYQIIKDMATARHRKAIQNRNYSFIHRVNFVHSFLRKQDDKEKQMSLDSMCEVSYDAGEIFCRSD